jgi:hypothetical protein
MEFTQVGDTIALVQGIALTGILNSLLEELMQYGEVVKTV